MLTSGPALTHTYNTPCSAQAKSPETDLEISNHKWGKGSPGSETGHQILAGKEAVGLEGEDTV